MPRAFRIVQRNAMVFRRMWAGSAVVTVLVPTLYLASMGLGVGALVDRGTSVLPGGVSYLTFLGPGLLAATCMQTAAAESSWPINGKMLWHRNYDAISGTPMRIVDIVLGELAWIAVRLLMISCVYAMVLAASGAVRSFALFAAVPAAVLTGLAVSGPVLAYAATLARGQNFNVLQRFIVMPLFLFSGTFFPITRLPLALQYLATVTPLYHGVELTRGIALHTLTVTSALVHVGFLVTLCAAGCAVALKTFARRLYV